MGRKITTLPAQKKSGPERYGPERRGPEAQHTGFACYSSVVVVLVVSTDCGVVGDLEYYALRS
jgi:hypothetical protein